MKSDIYSLIEFLGGLDEKTLFLPLPLLLAVSCSDGPGNKSVKELFESGIVYQEQANKIKLSKFSSADETLLKNKIQDPLKNIKLRYSIKAKATAQEDCKLKVVKTPSSYSMTGMPQGPFSTSYLCLSEKDLEVALSEIKAAQDKRVGETNHSACGSYSLGGCSIKFTQSDVDKIYEEKKEEYLSGFTKEVKKGEDVFDSEYRMVIDSGQDGSDSKKWRRTSLYEHSEKDS